MCAFSTSARVRSRGRGANPSGSPLQGRRQVGGGHDVGARQDDGPLDGLLELADVAGPGVPEQALDRVGAERHHTSAQSVGERPEEMRGQRHDILDPGAQRGHLDDDPVQPVEEVGPERVSGDQLGQGLVGGRDDPGVDPHGGRAADPSNRLLLQHAVQLDLGGHRERVDLVEKDRAAVGLLEEALLGADGPGEGSLHVPEELRFQQGLRQGAAVHGDEGRGRAQAAGVDQPRHQLLARAALALDEHRGVGRRHAADQVDDPEHGRPLRDEGREAALGLQGRPELVDLPDERAPLERLAHDQDELLRLERLGQVVEGAQLHRLHRRADAPERRQDDDLRPGIHPLRRLQDVDPALAVHPQVGDDHVERLLIQQGPRRGDAGRLPHGPSLAAQQHREREPHRRLVVHDEDAAGERLRHGASRGSAMRTRVPAPAALSISIAPPWAATIRCAMASPRPDPPGLLVWNGSNRRACWSEGIPGPASATSTTTWPFRAIVATRSASPGRVASSAFRTTFHSTCLIWSPSIGTAASPASRAVSTGALLAQAIEPQ